MMPVILSPQYLDRLCTDRDYEGLAWISAVVCDCQRFDPSDPTYGLPIPAFCLVERLAWFAQGVRSGAWTYYEATPLARQRAMVSALDADAIHPAFAEQYSLGMREWRSPSQMATLDEWLDRNDEANNRIVWEIVAANRELLQELVNTDL